MTQIPTNAAKVTLVAAEAPNSTTAVFSKNLQFGKVVRYGTIQANGQNGQVAT
ncbi:UNVERIFIED_CONTAM: hypothetical protein HDU68_003380, partial [Siphonaria sp. JEL0065]